MKMQYLVFIFSLFTCSLLAQESFTVTVVPSKLTYSGTGQIDLYGNPMKGATYGLTGYIYPGNYFENHCADTKDCGIIVVLTQDTVYTLPEHPGEVIGRWDMYGTATQDMGIVLAQGGTHAFGTEVFLFKETFTTCPDCKIVTEGKEHYGSIENESFKRIITGGTTEAYRLMRGEVDQVIYKQPENKNETGGYNMEVTFWFFKN
jgi:hypothetical protein